MTDEEYQRLKEAEKEHLRAKKKLQQALQTLRRKQRVRDAVDRIARSAQGALDRASDLIDKLTSETAHNEARFEIARDEVDDSDAPASDSELDAFEAERRAARARQLIQQMKQAKSVSASRKRKSRSSDEAQASSPSDESASGATSSDKDLSTSSTDDDLPDKTIGRMR